MSARMALDSLRRMAVTALQDGRLYNAGPWHLFGFFKAVAAYIFQPGALQNLLDLHHYFSVARRRHCTTNVTVMFFHDLALLH